MLSTRARGSRALIKPEGGYNEEDKSYGLDQLMKHQMRKDIKYLKDQLRSVNVYKLEVETFKGKHKLFPNH
jgi:hypothetical protein